MKKRTKIAIKEIKEKFKKIHNFELTVEDVNFLSNIIQRINVEAYNEGYSECWNEEEKELSHP